MRIYFQLYHFGTKSTYLICRQKTPSTHTTMFWHSYDVVLTLWTLYGRRNDVVYLLGHVEFESIETLWWYHVPTQPCANTTTSFIYIYIYFNISIFYLIWNLFLFRLQYPINAYIAERKNYFWSQEIYIYIFLAEDWQNDHKTLSSKTINYRFFFDFKNISIFQHYV